MPDQHAKVLLGGDPGGRPAGAPGRSSARAWRSLGWFGTLLFAIGIGDITLAFYPPRFGTVEWEFATVAASFAGLPLLTMGLAGVLASALARGRRRTVVLVSWTLIVLATLIVAAFVLFLTTVPIALRAVEGDALLGIKKAAVKTGMLGIAFAGAYAVAAGAALRHLARHRERS